MSARMNSSVQTSHDPLTPNPKSAAINGSMKWIPLYVLLAFGAISCTKYEHAKSVTLYDYKGESNIVFSNVTILEKHSNYIYFVTDDDNKPTKHNGRYTLEQ